MNLPLIPATSSTKKSPKAFPTVVVTRRAQRGRRRFGECAVSRKAGEWVAAAKEFSWTWKAKVTSTLHFFVELHTYYLPTYNWDSEKSKPWRFCLSSDVNTNHKVAAAAKVSFFYVNETLSACYLSPFFSAACLAPAPSLLIKLFTLLDEAIATVSGEATSAATEEGKKMTL